MSKGILEAAVRRALAPQRFFTPPGTAVRVAHLPRERCCFEIHAGHLLDHTQTRREMDFETWHVALVSNDPGGNDAGAETPLISVRLSNSDGRLYLTRNILIYGYEAYEAEPDVIRSRQTQRWAGELVGTFDLEGASQQNIEAALEALLAAAVFGRRLPVSSWESPLPAFALGQLSYRPQPRDGDDVPCHAPREWLAASLSPDAPTAAQVRALEAALRAVPPDDVPALAAEFHGRFAEAGRGAAEFARLFRMLFNQLALTPYTALGDNLVRFLEELAPAARMGTAAVLDAVGYMLRHMVRHLTAFDVHTFHNRGADYPDLLLLDALLGACVRLAESEPGRACVLPGDDSPPARRRRRALRQAWWARCHYEGLPVPPWPTSPGDNQRVLPAPFGRLDESQLLDPRARTRKLFAEAPMDRNPGGFLGKVLAHAIADLEHDAELRETGTAVFLDRPLGAGKPPEAVDRTTLLSYEAFSRVVVLTRLDELLAWGLLEAPQMKRLEQRAQQLTIPGVPVAELRGQPRIGVPCLEDASRASADFVFTRTTRNSLNDLVAAYDFSPLRRLDAAVHEWLHAHPRVLLIRRSGPGPLCLIGLDTNMQPRLELSADPDARYVEQCGVEYLRSGLRARVLGASSANAGEVALPARVGALPSS